MKNKKVLVLLVVILLSVMCVINLVIINTRGSEAYITNLDYATQNVINNKMLKDVSYEFKQNDFEITGIYYDGIRLYVTLDMDKSEKKNYEFSITGEDLKDNIQKFDKIESIPGDSNEIILISNNIDISKENSYSILVNQKNRNEKIYSENFKINNVKTKVIKLNNKINEILVNSIEMGKTSTYIDLDSNSLIYVSSFQLEVNGTAVSAIKYEKNEKNYKIIFPIDVNKEDKINLIINGSDGNIEFTIPIKL